MQLIQIGQPLSVTVHQLIEQMAARQSAEIAQLKQEALEKHAAAGLRVKTYRRIATRRPRFEQAPRKALLRASLR
jgi:hypothetical protein